MNTTLAALDVTVSSWLLQAFSAMIADPFYALLIILITTALLMGIVGKLWGVIWNKKWNFSGTRGLTIGLLSLMAGVSLAAVNGLYGGKFFQTEVAEAMNNILTEGSVKYTDVVLPGSGYTAAKPILESIQAPLAETDEEKEQLAKGEPIFINVDEKIVEPYFTALNMLWAAFWSIAAILIAGVAWFAYRDIKLIDAYKL